MRKIAHLAPASAIRRSFGIATVVEDVASKPNRSSLLKGVAAALPGVVAGRALDAEAPGTATLTIHNASCAKILPGQAIYNACHAYGVGCIDFYFRGRALRTNAKGRATAKVGALTIGQQKSRVPKSRSIYFFCADAQTNRVLYEGQAAGEQVDSTIHAGDQVICDWYNITKQDLALPQLCPGYTTTTTTTAAPAQTCALGEVSCASDAVCSVYAGAVC